MFSQVPFRRIQLTGGSGVFDVYDTSGPQARGPRWSLLSRPDYLTACLHLLLVAQNGLSCYARV